MKEASLQPDILNSYKKFLPWIVFGIAVLLYSNTLNHQFALDDYSVILEHRHVQNGYEGIPDLLTTNYRNGQLNFNDGLYRPFSLVTFALEKEWFNLNPSISHLVNVLIYAFACLLLYLALLNLLPDQSVVLPFSVVMLFCLHPLHTEVVANIKGRDDLLAFAGFSFCLWSSGSYLIEKRMKWLLLALFGYVIALFSKESSVTFALMIPALLYLNPAFNLKKILPLFSVFLLLSIGFFFLRLHVVSSMPNPIDPGNFGILNNPIAATNNLSLRWGSTFALQLLFISKLIFPFSLQHDYSFNEIPLVEVLSFNSLLGLLVLFFLIVLSIKTLINRNAFGTIAIIYLAVIAVAAQILLPIGAQFAERLLFMAVLPFSFFVVFGLKYVVNKKQAFSKAKQQQLLGIIFLIGVVFFMLSFNRNTDWENNFSLYQADVEKTDGSARIHYNYGSELSNQAERVTNQSNKTALLQQAEQHLNKALSIYPDYLDAANNLGIVYKKMGRLDQAITVYKNNISKDPDYTKNYYNLATAYFENKQYRNCIISMQAYVNRVQNSSAYLIMGRAAGNMNQFEEAIQYLEKAKQIDPTNLDVLNFLGMAYGLLNENAKAEQNFLSLLQIDPSRQDVLMNLAINYNKLGNSTAEINTLEKILQQNPNNKAALNQISLSLERMGNAELAAKYRARLNSI